ncbi:MAG TPA: hypothetical protein VLQ76_07340, partial [Bacteroidales bacterium]|nr:hypothetical protein [Bacteroidales bacterium]
MVQDTSGLLNLTWLIETLRSDKARDTLKKSIVRIAGIEIFDGAWSLTDLKDTVTGKPGIINFKDLRLTSLNARVEDMVIIPDSVSFNIRGMTFTESKGFTSTGLNMDAVIRQSSLYFRDIDLSSDSSIIKAERIHILPADSSAYSDFINRVRLDILLSRSVIRTSDVAYFVAPLKGIYETVYLSGKLTGTVAEMRGRDVAIDYSADTRWRCDFDISGLPVVNDIFMFLDFADLRTSADDIERLRLSNAGFLKLPVIAHDLGKVSFVGNFTGFITDFVAFGRLKTERGNFTTDISLRPDGGNSFAFKGLLKADQVDLGFLTKNNELFGGLTLHAEVDGSMESFKHLSANI